MSTSAGSHPTSTAASPKERWALSPGVLATIAGILTAVSTIAAIVNTYRASEVDERIAQQQTALDQRRLDVDKTIGELEAGIKQQQNDLEARKAAVDGEIKRIETDLNAQRLDLERRRSAVDEEMKRIETNVLQQQIDLEVTKFKATERERKELHLVKQIPSILSSEEREKRTAISIIFALYPNEAKDILESISQAVAETPEGKPLATAIQQAKDLDVATGAWTVIVGADAKLDEAKHEVQRARDRGFTPTLYLRGGLYRTTVSRFPTQADAESASISARAKLRSDAYVVNLKSWCPEMTVQTDFVQCGTGQ